MLTRHPHLQWRGLKLGRAIRLPTLRTLVACYRESLYLYQNLWSRGSAVSIAVGLRAWQTRIRLLARGKRYFSFRKRPHQLRGPPNLLIGGYRDMNYINSSMTRLAIISAIAVVPLYAFMAWKGANLYQIYGLGGRRNTHGGDGMEYSLNHCWYCHRVVILELLITKAATSAGAQRCSHARYCCCNCTVHVN